MQGLLMAQEVDTQIQTDYSLGEQKLIQRNILPKTGDTLTQGLQN